MKLGIIRGYDDAAFKYVKDHSLDFIEVCTNFDPESENFIAAAEGIKALIDKYEVPILSVGRWNAEVVKDGRISADTVALLKKQIDVVAAIGSPVFNIGVNRDESRLRRSFACATIVAFARSVPACVLVSPLRAASIALTSSV